MKTYLITYEPNLTSELTMSISAESIVEAIELSKIKECQIINISIK